MSRQNVLKALRKLTPEQAAYAKHLWYTCYLLALESKSEAEALAEARKARDGYILELEG